MEFSTTEFEDFTVHFKTKEIKPKITEKISIYFHPLTAKSYKTQAIFFINSKAYPIHLRGNGVPLLLEVLDEKDKFVDFGSPLIGKTVIKTIKVINKSKATVAAIFDLIDRLPIFSRKNKKFLSEFEEDKPKVNM